MLIRYNVIEWHTTPDELRAIANDLESQWKKCLLGNIIPGSLIAHDKDQRIIIKIAQERMPPR